MTQHSALKPPPQLPTVHAGRMSPALATPGSGAGTPASRRAQRSCAKRITVSQLFDVDALKLYDHRRSAAAAARGQITESTLAASTVSPHMHIWPPRMSGLTNALQEVADMEFLGARDGEVGAEMSIGTEEGDFAL